MRHTRVDQGSQCFLQQWLQLVVPQDCTFESCETGTAYVGQEQGPGIVIVDLAEVNRDETPLERFEYLVSRLF